MVTGKFSPLGFAEDEEPPSRAVFFLLFLLPPSLSFEFFVSEPSWSFIPLLLVLEDLSLQGYLSCLPFFYFLVFTNPGTKAPLQSLCSVEGKKDTLSVTVQEGILGFLESVTNQ